MQLRCIKEIVPEYKATNLESLRQIKPLFAPFDYDTYMGKGRSGGRWICAREPKVVRDPLTNHQVGRAGLWLL